MVLRFLDFILQCKILQTKINMFKENTQNITSAPVKKQAKPLQHCYQHLH